MVVEGFERNALPSTVDHLLRFCGALSALPSISLEGLIVGSQGFVLVADLLGFGAMVSNLTRQGPGKLDDRITAWTKLVATAAEHAGVSQFRLMSDTVFAAVGNSRENFHRLVGFAQELLSVGIEQSFPIRGAIAGGSYVWGDLTYGEAVIRAHALEQRQNWVGVACDLDASPHFEKAWNPERVVAYLVPMKSGTMQIIPAVAWQVPKTHDLLSLMVQGGLLRHGEQLTWPVGEKLNNTALFGLYLEQLRIRKLSGEHFLGECTTHLIEAALQGQ